MSWLSFAIFWRVSSVVSSMLDFSSLSVRSLLLEDIFETTISVNNQSFGTIIC